METNKTYKEYLETYYEDMKKKYKLVGDPNTYYDEKSFKKLHYTEMSDKQLKDKIHQYTKGNMNEIKRFRIYVFNDILMKRRMSKLNKIKSNIV